MGELVSEVARLNDQIDSFSYYEFLAVDQDTDYIGIRDAFYERAQRFHPDRFVALGGETVKRAVYAVYKRMTEAYQVLTDPNKRQAYDQFWSEALPLMVNEDAPMSPTQPFHELYYQQEKESGIPPWQPPSL